MWSRISKKCCEYVLVMVFGTLTMIQKKSEIVFFSHFMWSCLYMAWRYVSFLWSFFLIGNLSLSGIWQGLRWRIEKPKRHMLWRDWNMCQKCRHYSTFHNQHNWEALYNHFKGKRIFTLKPNILKMLTPILKFEMTIFCD